MVLLHKITGKHRKITYIWDKNTLIIKDGNDFKTLADFSSGKLFVPNEISFAKIYAELHS